LSKADFTLSDNGAPKVITEFEVHESGETRVAVPSNAVDLATIRQEAKRRYFFVLDMQASDIYGNRDAKKAVLEFAENHLHPGDEACVMTFGALTGLVLRQYLTSDLDKVRLALRRSIDMYQGRAGVEVAGGGGGGAPARDEGIAKYGIGGAGELPTGGGASGQARRADVVDASRYSADETREEAGSIELDTAGGGWFARAARSKADSTRACLNWPKP
jgi:hypothetical protein